MRRLLLVLLLLPTLASAAALSKLRVVDSAGKTVGYVLDLYSPGSVDFVSVVRREQGVYLTFLSGSATLQPLGGLAHYFESADCTGTGFGYAQASLLQNLTEYGPGQFEFTIGASQNRTLQSTKQSASGPCIPIAPTVYPTQAIGTLDLGQFVPPFRIK